MADGSLFKAWGPALVAVAVLLSMWLGPDRGSPSQPVLAGSAEDTQQQLQGTWLREQAADGMAARHLLMLEPGGVFRETVRVTAADGATTEYLHEGTWLFDGTNLKRKYTLMNGKPPSRLNVPFATFEVRFTTRNEFTGIDHIHGNRILYRRVAPETES